MDAYISLAVIIIILLIGLVGFVVYKESGWKLVNTREHRERHRRNHEYYEHHRR